MTTPPGPEPGQSLEDWVRESLLGPLPGEQESGEREPTTPDDAAADALAAVVPAQRAAPPGPPVVVPAQRIASPVVATTAAGPGAAAVPVVPDAPRRRRRVALGAAAGVVVAVGLAMAMLVPAPPLPAPGGAGLAADATSAAARPAAPAPVQATVVSTPVPPAVPVAFAGGRVDVGGGWWIGVTRPYLCPVLMAVPALMSGDSRLVRMTITIVNATGTPQPARSWTLRATADGSPVEMVLWPSAGFRGVPDRVLAPGERVRFLVAVRLPARQVAVEVAAEHPAGPRATLTGRA